MKNQLLRMLMIGAWTTAWTTHGEQGKLALQRLITFGTSDEETQPTSLIQGSDGYLYGTAGDRRATNGWVFRMTPAGQLTVLASFDSDCCPRALVQAADRSFYGATYRAAPGYGTIFHLTTNGAVNTIHSFSGTEGRSARVLIYGSDGNLYGVAENGGSGYGTIFKLSAVGELTTLFSFSRTNGINPTSLLRGSDGALYGTTSDWIGVNAPDTVFKLSPSGEFSILISSFDSEIRRPLSLIKGADGCFYGLDNAGGSNRFGSIFKVTADGMATILAEFNGTNGWGPDRLVQSSDGSFYGTTGAGGPDFAGWIPDNGGFMSSGSGTIFRLTSNGELTALASFQGMTGNDVVGFLQSEACIFYGAITSGEPGEHASVFRLAPQPRITALHRASGGDVLCWNSFTGGAYQVEHKSTLSTGVWRSLGAPMIANSTKASVTNLPVATAEEYYRVRLLP